MLLALPLLFEGNDITVNEFTEVVGPTFEVNDPVDVFGEFLTNDLLQMIVLETNRYAAACIERDERDNVWETSIDEIKSFLGFCILMGINRLPATSDYWSTDTALHYHPVASRISRSRYTQLKKYLHFVDNRCISKAGEEGYNRLAKIQPVIDHVRQAFLSKFLPNCQNSIDEAMIKFKGRSTLKQYMPNKPIKRGFKVWVRADSLIGYISDFSVYTGSKDGNKQVDLGGTIVKKLAGSLIGRANQHLYFDNYFSSPQLFLDLLDLNLYACGTYRYSRVDVPIDIKTTKLSRT